MQVNNLSFLSENDIATATKHISDILTLAILHTNNQNAVIVFDKGCDLAIVLTEAYRRSLPNALFIDFDTKTPEEIKASFTQLNANDLVVLIQSTNFRLDAFRLRVELFKQALKVIEHPHLSRMLPHEEIYYIDALAYDKEYFYNVGHTLKNKIDVAAIAILDSDGEKLIFDSPLEKAKLNIGDYSQMVNIGGQFPIGEVFTEAQDLEKVNGKVRIFAFGDRTFTVNQVQMPITLVISKGRVVDTVNSTAEFDLVLANIQADEGEVWLRELGFGMNRAFSKSRTVSDIGTYERMCGIHLSLGAKHGTYKKNNINRNLARHHVDVFAVTKFVYLDDEIVYSDDEWRV